MPNLTGRASQGNVTEEGKSATTPSHDIPSAVVHELLMNPQRCIFKTKRGSRPHCLALCASVRALDEKLHPSVFHAILSHSSRTLENDLILAKGIIFAICTVAFSEQNDPVTRKKNAQAIDEPIIEHWKTLAQSARMCFDAFFDGTLGDFSDFDVSLLGPSESTFVLRIFLLTISSNQTSGRRFFRNESLLRHQLRFWLHDMANSKPGRCPAESQEIFWKSYLYADVQKFFNVILEESEPTRIAYYAVSELRHCLRRKNASGPHIISHTRTLMSIMVGPRENVLHEACVAQGAITSLTKGCLRLLHSGYERPNGIRDTVVPYLAKLRCLLESRDTIPLLIQAIQCGLFAIIVEASKFVATAAGELCDACIEVLATFLPHYLAFDSVVRVAVDAMAQIDSHVFDGIQTTILAEPWNTFRTLLLERAIFKCELDMSIRSHGRKMSCYSCDWMFPVSELKTCARCKNVLYCSKECQKDNWGPNRIHKEFCDLWVCVSKAQPILRLSDAYFFTQIVIQDFRFYLNDIRSALAREFPGVPWGYLLVDADLAESPRVYNIGIYDEDYGNGGDTENALKEGKSGCRPLLSNDNGEAEDSAAEDEQLLTIDINFTHVAGKSTTVKSTVFSPSDITPIPPLRPSFDARDLEVFVRSSSVLRSQGKSTREHKLQGSYDEVNAILKYVMMKKGLEDTYTSVSSFRYTWDELCSIAAECRESDWWPLESLRRPLWSRIRVRFPQRLCGGHGLSLLATVASIASKI